jgi:hydrogenase maturation protease
MTAHLQRTLVLGIGNTLLGDDGAGVHALRYLEKRPEGRLLELVDAGTLGFTLLPLIEDHARLIVIDAALLEAPPGTVRLFQGTAMDSFLSRPRRSVHEIGICDLLHATRLGGRFPDHRALIGIQPEIVSWQDGPSPVVAAAFATVGTVICQLLSCWDDLPTEEIA